MIPRGQDTESLHLQMLSTCFSGAMQRNPHSSLREEQSLYKASAAKMGIDHQEKQQIFTSQQTYLQIQQ